MSVFDLLKNEAHDNFSCTLFDLQNCFSDKTKTENLVPH